MKFKNRVVTGGKEKISFTTGGLFFTNRQAVIKTGIQAKMG
jgi:hypothetical protein